MQEKHAPKNFRHFISIKSQYPLNMQNLKRILYLFFNHPSKIPYRFLSIGYYRVCAVQLSTCIFIRLTINNTMYFTSLRFPKFFDSVTHLFFQCFVSSTLRLIPSPALITSLLLFHCRLLLLQGRFHLQWWMLLHQHTGLHRHSVIRCHVLRLFLLQREFSL